MARILVLGGTHFVGRAVVDEALQRGWTVATIHRTFDDSLPRSVRQFSLDRTQDDAERRIAEIGRSYRPDLVVDTWSAAPRVVLQSARALAGTSGRYAYISSRSVYDDPTTGANEEWPLVTADANDTESADYARAKAGGEAAVESAFGDRTLVLRPGLILGPREDLGRLPWWLRRMARGGDVLAPGPRDGGIQWIDARDLAAFALDAAQSSATGPFDVVTPVGTATMADLLEACVEATGHTARQVRLHWVHPDRVLAAGITPWIELPVWLPPGPEHRALHESDVSKAFSAGLKHRPLSSTVIDTAAWIYTMGGTAPTRPDRPVVGLDPGVERRVLEEAGIPVSAK